jgi:hypothetical protein
MPELWTTCSKMTHHNIIIYLLKIPTHWYIEVENLPSIIALKMSTHSSSTTWTWLLLYNITFLIYLFYIARHVQKYCHLVLWFCYATYNNYAPTIPSEVLVWCYVDKLLYWSIRKYILYPLIYIFCTCCKFISVVW